MEMERKTETVTGQFYRELWKSDDGRSISLYTSTDKNFPSFVKTGTKTTTIKVYGYNLPEEKNLLVKFIGTWEDNKKYGPEFSAISYEYATPSTTKGLISFLSSGIFPGIGPITAKKIVDKFGTEALDVIGSRTRSKELLTIRGITLQKVGLITAAYESAQSYSQVAVFLGNCGIGGKTILKINEELQPFAAKKETTVKAMIEENPYVLMNINGISFSVCDRIAVQIGKALNSYQRISAGIMEYITNRTKMSGGMFVHIDVLREETLNRLNAGFSVPPVKAEELEDALQKMREQGSIVIRSNKAVYKKKAEKAEYETCQGVVKLLKSNFNQSESEIEKTVAEYCAQSPIVPSEKQRNAIVRCLENRFSIITGGPGTGKTTIIKGVIWCYSKLNPTMPVTCMAPTGKAARRMSEATEREATTIHKRLHLYDTENINLDPEEIPEGLVLVDEVSMVDNYLAYKLLEAVDSKKCQLILIGDVDQLPSVGPGAVLQELINSDVVPYTRLTEIFRQKNGGVIVENAIKVNLGKENLVYNDDFQFIKAASDEEALKKITGIYVDECKKWGIENVALLSPRRSVSKINNGKKELKCVADAMNPILRNLVNPTTDKEGEKGTPCMLAGKEFRIGDRIMQWKNSELSSNGDIGTIVGIHNNEEEEKVLDVVWENGNKEVVDRKKAENIGLAYAMSIHKSQGSEYDCVIIPMISEQRCPLFRRNLLYTGITRAKKKVIIVGDENAVNYSIRTKDGGTRATLLSARLQYNMKA